MIRKLILLCLLLSGIDSFSQSTCDSLKLIKEKVYGFKPAELNDSLKELKSAELDSFWTVAKNNRSKAAPCVQSMIEDETNDSYFCFDASSLLLSLDTSQKYFATVVNGLKKCRLEDLQLSSYLQMCCYLAYKGEDVSELSTRFISVPNASVFLANHFITLNAIDASIFLFNTMPEDKAESVLTSALMNGNATAKYNAAALLNLMATDSGDSMLNSMMDQKLLSDSAIKYIKKDRKQFIIKPKGKESRAKVLEALNDVPYNFEKQFYGFAGSDELIGSACKQLTKRDVEIIRAARRRSTPGLSDEALHEYFALTTILMTVRDKKD